jgi:hypothetical protein
MCVCRYVCAHQRRGSVLTAPVEVTLAASAPEIKSMPDPSVEVALGETLVLEVVARGVPAPSFQWTRDGSELHGEASPRRVILSVGPDHPDTVRVCAVVLLCCCAAVLFGRALLFVCAGAGV